MPVYIQNDATAACGAELVFGTGEKPKDFLYFYFGKFIGGGLVLNGHLFTGRRGNAGGVGPLPVPGPDGTFGATEVPKQGAHLRTIFKGPLVLNSDYDHDKAVAAMAGGMAGSPRPVGGKSLRTIPISIGGTASIRGSG